MAVMPSSISGLMSFSSRRVPDLEMSIAGQMRRSASSRLSTSSMLPVPLNSWKIASSMCEPVWIRAVPTTVTLPPSSNMRAVANSFLGTSIARTSRPPVPVRPVLVHLLNARAVRVMESIRRNTSLPISASRLVRSRTSWEMRTWFSSSRSMLLATTSPLTLRRMSVTSSGRSSMSSTMRWHSGWLCATESAICCIRIVLPLRGGATIRARWPLPMGHRRSSTRMVIGAGPTSSLICSSGLMGVRSSKWGVSRYSSGSLPSMLVTDIRRGPCPRWPGPTSPVSRTPSRSPSLSIIWPETKGSVSCAA